MVKKLANDPPAQIKNRRSEVFDQITDENSIVATNPNHTQNAINAVSYGLPTTWHRETREARKNAITNPTTYSAIKSVIFGAD